MILDFLSKHWEFIAGLFVCVIGFNLYSVYCRKKDLIIKDINRIIDDCRELRSFDEKSEDKMSSWLELGESDLHGKSLIKLRKIKKEMIRYFQIHLDMDIEKYD